MKALYQLLIILFLTKYSNEVCDSIEPINKTDCIKAKKEKDEAKCCYVYFNYYINSTEYNETYCKGFNQTGYEYMDVYFKDEVESRNDTANETVIYAEIDCGGGKNLFISMLSLLYILI